MRIWRLIALCVLASILAACGGAQSGPAENAATPILPTGAEGDANSIPILTSGQSITGTLFENVTAILYAFNATEGDSITVNMVQAEGSSLDPFIVVLDNFGGVVGSDDNSGSFAGSSQLSFQAPKSGTYFVIASSAATIDGVQSEFIGQQGVYVLQVDGNNPPPELGQDVVYARGELQYDIPPEVRGYSAPREPVFYYAFQGQAGDVVTIVMNSLEMDSMLSLYDPQGIRIAVNDDARTLQLLNPSDSALEEITLPATGTYLIMATDVQFPQADASTYEGGFFDIIVNKVR
jgi:hypothetical protein